MSFNNYQDILKYFKSCRSPAKGKPFASWARIYLEGDTLIVKTHYTQFCKITPDDVIEFDIPSQARYTMSQVLENFVPFAQCNVAPNTYVLYHTDTMREIRNLKRGLLTYRQTAREYGYLVGLHPLRFNLRTGECLNPPNMPASVANRDKNTEASKDWLRAIKDFNRQMRLRDKLGVIEAVFTEAVSEAQKKSMASYGRPDSHYTKVSGAQKLEIVHSAIKDGQVTTDVIRALLTEVIYRSVIWNRSTHKADYLYKEIQLQLRYMSIKLRHMFGVFNNEVTKND